MRRRAGVSRQLGQLLILTDLLLASLAPSFAPLLAHSWSLTKASDYRILNQGSLTIDNIDDKAEYEDVLRALETVGAKKEQVDTMLQLLAGIMHLGNVEFEADEHDNAQIKASCKSTSLKHSMKLLQCPVLDVKLMTRIVKAKGRNSIYTVPLNLTEAQEARDALAKAVYDNLFFYLISLCNSNLHSHSKIEVRQSRERSDESRQRA